LYPASRRSTNDERREGPPHAAETASLPELTLEDRVACALARRGPLPMAVALYTPVMDHMVRTSTDAEFVADLEREIEARA
jgi:hypothetical protein